MAFMEPNVFIFIPAYNAAATLPDVIGRIPQSLWPRLSVTVIDDGSSDDTSGIVLNLINEYPSLKLEKLEVNGGYGGAVKRGLTLAGKSGADFAVCVHADGQYPPEKVPEFIDYMIMSKTGILQGSRHKGGGALKGGMPFYKYIAGKALSWLENRTFKLQMTDYHSGFMFYSRQALDSIQFQKLSGSFDFDLEVIASACSKGLKVEELAIPTRYADEKSYLNPITYGLRVLGVLIRYRLGVYK